MKIYRSVLSHYRNNHTKIIYKIINSFIYLIGFYLTPCSRIFHWYDVGQHYGGRKPGSGRRIPTAIRRLMPDRLTYGLRGRQHELDLNSHRLHWQQVTRLWRHWLFILGRKQRSCTSWIPPLSKLTLITWLKMATKIAKHKQVKIYTNVLEMKFYIPVHIKINDTKGIKNLKKLYCQHFIKLNINNISNNPIFM